MTIESNIVLKKIMKWKWVLGILIFGLSVEFVLWPWYFFGERQVYTKGALESHVEELLGIPFNRYFPFSEKDLEKYKTGSNDLEYISRDEWMNMKCKHPFDEEKLANFWPEFAALTPGQRLIYRHRECIAPELNVKNVTYSNKTLRHCTSIFNCSSISFWINEYALQYPKVLNNLIKVAEKPCDYLKNVDPKNDFSLNHSIKQRRDELYCDKTKVLFYEKDRTYTVIRVLGSDAVVKAEIIVPRKDNAHLVKR